MKWNNAEEKLPRVYKEQVEGGGNVYYASDCVLTYGKSGYAISTYYKEPGGKPYWHSWDENFPYDEEGNLSADASITHWMPLPNPPEEVEEDG